MKTIKYLTVLFVLLPFAAAVYFLPMLPDKIAIHWNALGEADGYSAKAFALFFLPSLTLILTIILKYVPRLDPLRKNFESFKKSYDIFVFVFVLFFSYIFLFILLSGLGMSFDVNRALAPAFAVFFWCVGYLLGHAKRNWFVGIRTPWTMSSDNVWDKTHMIGKKIFSLAAILVLFGVLFPKSLFIFLLFSALGSVFFLIIYSYFIYKKEKKSENQS